MGLEHHARITEVLDYLNEAYDIDETERIYINGDGAPWIQTGTNFNLLL